MKESLNRRGNETNALNYLKLKEIILIKNIFIQNI